MVEHFYCDLDWIVMDLLEIDENNKEEIYVIYDTHFKRLEQLPVDSFYENLNTLALRLYSELLAKKKVLRRRY